jgi:hypothetical protein
MLRTGRGPQSRSPAWPTRDRHQPGDTAPATGLLGAMPEALKEFDKCRESLGRGNVRITFEPGRKNLLRLPQ